MKKDRYSCVAKLEDLLMSMGAHPGDSGEGGGGKTIMLSRGEGVCGSTRMGRARR